MKAFKKSTFKLGLQHYVMIMTLTVVGLVGVVLFFFHFSYQQARRDAIEKGEANLIISSARTDNYLTKATNVLEITVKTIEYMHRNQATPKTIEKFLFDQSQVYKDSIDPNYTAMYGLYCGEYVDGTGWTPPEDYNPRKRPWYMDAKKGDGKTVIIPPYVDADTHAIIISVAKLLSDKKSVIALDIRMDELQTYADNLHHGSGHGFIIDRIGLIVAHEDRREIGKNYLTDKALQNCGEMRSVIRQVLEAKGEARTISYAGDEYILFSNRVKADWIAVVMMNHDELLAAVRKPLLQGVCIALVVIFFIWLFLSVCFRSLISARNRAVSAEEGKSMFFATISHDIRTPLNSIIGFSELLERGGTDPDTARDYLGNIIFSGKTLLLLINDVLDLAKLDAKKMQYFYTMCNLEELAKHVMNSFQHEACKRDLKLMLDTPPSLPMVKTDHQRIRQMLFNLVGNAVKFTNRGTITLRIVFEPKNDSCGQLRIAVEDTGIGIAEHDLPHLRRPFAQLNTKSRGLGTGLGLSICNAMIKQMGGELTIESKLGVGSTFTMFFPEIEFQEASAAKLPECEPEPILTNQEKIRLLLVDDVPMNLKVLSAMCMRLGIKHVDCAHTGSGALEQIKRNKYDAVMTDFWMPDISGKDLAFQIHQIRGYADFPIFAVTADVDKLKEWKNMGFAGLILKPITLNNLAEHLSVLSQKKGNPEAEDRKNSVMMKSNPSSQ